MTPSKRQAALNKLYFALQTAKADCETLDLPDIAADLWRHAERVGKLAAAIPATYRSDRRAEGKSGDGR